MTKQQLKELLDELDFTNPLYFIEINWRANLYEVKEVCDWKIIYHNNDDVFFGYEDKNHFILGYNVFMKRTLAEAMREVKNREVIKLKLNNGAMGIIEN